MDEIMTIREVSKYLKMNERTISKLAVQGLIPGTKIANQWRFMRSLINQWLERQMLSLPLEQLEMLETELVSNPIQVISYLAPDAIIPDSEARQRIQVLQEMVDLAVKKKYVKNSILILKALLKRESICSTAVGDEVAIPHPRYPMNGSCLKPAIVMARSRRGIDFDAHDDLPVKLIFLLCLPDDYTHLKVLARLTRMLKDSHFREALKSAEDSAAIYDLIRRKDEELSHSNSN